MNRLQRLLTHPLFGFYMIMCLLWGTLLYQSNAKDTSIKMRTFVFLSDDTFQLIDAPEAISDSNLTETQLRKSLSKDTLQLIAMLEKINKQLTEYFIKHRRFPATYHFSDEDRLRLGISYKTYADGGEFTIEGDDFNLSSCGMLIYASGKTNDYSIHNISTLRAIAASDPLKDSIRSINEHDYRYMMVGGIMAFPLPPGAQRGTFEAWNVPGTTDVVSSEEEGILRRKADNYEELYNGVIDRYLIKHPEFVKQRSFNDTTLKTPPPQSAEEGRILSMLKRHNDRLIKYFLAHKTFPARYKFSDAERLKYGLSYKSTDSLMEDIIKSPVPINRYTFEIHGDLIWFDTNEISIGDKYKIPEFGILQAITKSNPVIDAKKSISKRDFRFVAVGDYPVEYPGIEDEKMLSKYGVWMIPKSGNVFSMNSDEKKQRFYVKKAWNYASEYNKVILNHLNKSN